MKLPSFSANQLRLILIGGIVLALFGLILLYLAGYRAERQAPETPPIVAPNPFDSVYLEARAAAVYDLETGQMIYELNAQTPFPLASITKIMTALVASHQLAGDSPIAVTPAAIAELGDSGFLPGERWSLKNLLDFTLITSSNDGARALALASEETTGESFVSAMNLTAGRLGLATMSFANPTGLDVAPGQAGAYGSAADVAKLLAHIIVERPEIVLSTRLPSASIASAATSHLAINTNKAAGLLPGLIASKTGFTDLADGNLAVVIDRGLRQPVAIVVLSSSQEGRFNDVLKLTRATIAYFAEPSR